MTRASAIPLSLYLHFPWCVSKCPYCDFNSHALREPLPESRYLEALVQDMELQAADLSSRSVDSVFLGGGTPSLFSPQAIARVLDAAHRCLAIASDVEVTLEANPGTIERGRFAEYQAAGINRVSLGAQSFDARQLEALGRIHTLEETQRAAHELHAAGLSNFNIDLMYALPGQDTHGALRDVEQALALDPAHVSHYQLTIEAGTRFAADPPRLPGDDHAAEMLEVCAQRLTSAGFARYEVSAYARAGRRCRHNLNYWTFGDYVGAGAGAHGKLSFATDASIVRTVQLREPRRYLAAAPRALTCAGVAPRDLPFEFMLNALRLVDGFEIATFEIRTGLDWQIVAAPVQRLIGKGLLEIERGRCRPSALGLAFLNDILLEFVPEKASRCEFSALSIAS